MRAGDLCQLLDVEREARHHNDRLRGARVRDHPPRQRLELLLQSRETLQLFGRTGFRPIQFGPPGNTNVNHLRPQHLVTTPRSTPPSFSTHALSPSPRRSIPACSTMLTAMRLALQHSAATPPARLCHHL